MKKIEKRYYFSEDFFPPLLEYMREGHLVSFHITGYSMWPLLCHQRDLVVISEYDINKLRRGDIILFRNQAKQYAVHRIIRVRDGMMETIGDGNLKSDGWFPLECAEAKVVSVVRKGRTINCNSIFWKCAFSLWLRLLPIRGLLLQIFVWISKR